jgi:iron complex outermembrane receptor protein
MKRLFVITLAMLSFTHVLQAQDTLRTIELEEIAITPQRASMQDPVPQITLDRKDLQTADLGQNPVLLLERASPSIISFSDAGTRFGNYNQIRMRGMDQSRINFTLNGVPLNDMVDQGTFFSNFTDFTSSMQSVQVQRGVGISPHGTASYAGAISFQSVNLGRTDPFGALNLSAGSFGSFRLNAEGATGRLANDFSAYARVSRTVSEGYRDHSGTNAHSLFFSGAKFFENSVLKITALAGKTQNDQAYLPVLLDDLKANPRTNYFDRDDTDNFEQEIIQLQYIRYFNDRLSLSSSAYYNGSRGFFPFTFGDQFLYTVENDHLGFFSNIQYEGKRMKVTAGIHTYHMNRKNEEAIAPNISQPYYQDETEKQEFSGFGKLEYTITSRLTVSADLQLRALRSTYTSDSLAFYTGNASASRDDFFVNPKIGLNYQVNARSSVFASFGRVGREPTRADLLVDPNNFSFIYSGNFEAFTNEDRIESEFVNDLELGYRYQHSGLQLNINAFYMQFENEIAVVGGLAGNSYFPVRRNVPSSVRTGLEMDMNYQVNPQWTLSLLGTYMRTRVDEFQDGGETFEDVEHAFAPEWQFMPALTWMPLKALSMGLEGRYVSESFMELSNDEGLTLPSFFVANAQISWMMTKETTLSLRVNNLLDEEYYTDGTPLDADFDGAVDGPAYRIQPPRNIMASLRVQF